MHSLLLIVFLLDVLPYLHLNPDNNYHSLPQHILLLHNILLLHARSLHHKLLLFRLKLSRTVGEIIARALSLLGMEVPQRM